MVLTHIYRVLFKGTLPTVNINYYIQLQKYTVQLNLNLTETCAARA